MATIKKVKIEAKTINNLFCFFKSFLVICFAKISPSSSTVFSIFIFLDFTGSSLEIFLLSFFLSSVNSG